MNPFDAVVNAPVSAISATSPFSASALAATTTTVSSSSDLIVAATPTSVTESTEVPPPCSDSPVIVTRVPNCPISGSMFVMLDALLNVNPSASVTTAPVFETITMSPLPVVDPAMRTLIKSLDADMTRVFSPTSVTLVADDPPPSSRSPEMLTNVPSCPLAGFTASTAPSSLYVKPLVTVVVAPEVASRKMSTLPADALLALRTTSVAFADKISASVEPSFAVVISSLAAAPLPSRSVPVIVTRVPACPDDGSIFVISLASTYSKPSLKVIVAPESEVSTTSPVFAADSPARTSAVSSESPFTIDPTATPANVTAVSLVPPASNLVPLMVILVPTCPLSGETSAILLSVYLQPPDLVTTAPVSAVSTTSTGSVVGSPAAATTST